MSRNQMIDFLLEDALGRVASAEIALNSLPDGSMTRTALSEVRLARDAIVKARRFAETGELNQESGKLCNPDLLALINEVKRAL